MYHKGILLKKRTLEKNVILEPSLERESLLNKGVKEK